MGGLMGKDGRSSTRRGGVKDVAALPTAPPSEVVEAQPPQAEVSGASEDVEAPGVSEGDEAPESPARTDLVALPNGRIVPQCTLCTRAVGSCPRECPDESVLLSPAWLTLPEWTLTLVRRLFHERAAAQEVLQAERAGWQAKCASLEEDLLAARETRGIGEAPGRVLAEADDVVDVEPAPKRPPAPSSSVRERVIPYWKPSVSEGPEVVVVPRPAPERIPAPGGITACSCKHLFGTSCPRCKGTGWVSA